MKIRHVLPAIVAAAAAVVPLAAQADSLIYATTGLITGQQSNTETFNITAPGTLTVSLAALPWLDTISDMSVYLSSGADVIGQSISSGTESLSVTPGTFSAHFFGDADGAYGMGVYAMNISFLPSAGGTAVPLPASLLLLLSGLGILFGWQRRERSLEQTEALGDWA